MLSQLASYILPLCVRWCLGYLCTICNLSAVGCGRLLPLWIWCLGPVSVCRRQLMVTPLLTLYQYLLLVMSSVKGLKPMQSTSKVNDYSDQNTLPLDWTRSASGKPRNANNKWTTVTIHTRTKNVELIQWNYFSVICCMGKNITK